LGGSHLYRGDALAPLRELIQNARDAIELRNAVEAAEGRDPTPGRIVVSLEHEEGHPILSVRDNGIGMTRSVVIHHLISVGSDFWHSAEFYRDFGKALDHGFRPIGKFGIGFLSVFMLGDRIEVSSECVGNPGISLRLTGLGRRGALRETPITGHYGTNVRVFLKPELAGSLAHLASVVRARAPMLHIPITIQYREGGILKTDEVQPGWWKHIDDDTLCKFVNEWPSMAYTGSIARKERFVGNRPLGSYEFSLPGWPGSRPQFVNFATRAISLGWVGQPAVIRCAQGIAIDVVSVTDVAGLAECGEMLLTVAREGTPSESSAKDLKHRLLKALQPDVIGKLNELERFGLISARIGFLRDLALLYGREVLMKTTVRWIPVIEPPGNLIHRSRIELLESLKGEQRIVLASGVAPGSAYSNAATFIPADELGRMLIVALSEKEVDFDYDHGQKLKLAGEPNPLFGPLDSILRKIWPNNPNLNRLTLTSHLIDLVAEAWGTTNEVLCNEGWYLRYEYATKVLLADLKRKS
jgi:Histidine kinase-, DNA gyrase B-, and HSP90-like ATPase